MTAQAALNRHDLVWLDAAAWQRLMAQAVEAPTQDAVMRQCLQEWSTRKLPLVVTQQACQSVSNGLDAMLALGLAAPLRWDRRRIAVQVGLADVSSRGRFPDAAAIAQQLPAPSRKAWVTLCDAIEDVGARAAVYGSHGWQQLTGLDYLRPSSDIDLWLQVDSVEQADAVVDLLVGFSVDERNGQGPRLDGELGFPDGAAVAWREWCAWKAGEVDQLLVKRLHGPGLACASNWAWMA